VLPVVHSLTEDIFAFCYRAENRQGVEIHARSFAVELQNRPEEPVGMRPSFREKFLCAGTVNVQWIDLLLMENTPGTAFTVLISNHVTNHSLSSLFITKTERYYQIFTRIRL